MPQINKNLYLGVIFGGPILFLVLLVVGILLMFVQNDALTLAASGLICFGYIPAIAGIVFTAMLVYKLWDSIQDGTARTTPGKGVGFLFIPFFNFYWIFVAYLGWSQDFNSYIRERNIQAEEVNEKNALIMCILAVCAIIPYLGILIALANIYFLFKFFNQAIDGANAVRATKAPAPEPGL